MCDKCLRSSVGVSENSSFKMNGGYLHGSHHSGSLTHVDYKHLFTDVTEHFINIFHSMSA